MDVKRYNLVKSSNISHIVFLFTLIMAIFWGHTIGKCETPLIVEKDILSEEVYSEYEQVKNKLWIEEQLNATQKIAVSSSTVTLPIVMAAWAGWVHPYIYVWNSNTSEYEIRSAFELTGLTKIPAWSGFWVQVKRDVNVLIWPWKLSSPWPPWDLPDAPSSMSYTLQPDIYNLISVPLVPPSENIGTNFSSALGPDEYEETWRFSKWDTSSNQYIRYNGPDDPNNEYLKLIPGRGFWAYHIHPDAKVLTVEGPTVPALSTIAFKAPLNGSSTADYMLGNPFHYDICWWNVGVQIEINDSLPLGKIANENVNTKLESWYVGLELKDNVGNYQDTFNRAGVVETGENWPDLLSANDMVPVGDHVRIAIKNPNSPEKNPMAYDYRYNDSDEFCWEVELATTLHEVDAQLILNNFESVPSNYHITLFDNESNNTIDIVDDTSINLILNKNETKTFLLQATRLSPTSVNNVVPVEVKLDDAYPNPFNPATTISFSLPQSSYVTLTVYNILGEKVETLAEREFSTGVHAIHWNAASYASGIYYYRIETESFAQTKRMTLIK